MFHKLLLALAVIGVVLFGPATARAESNILFIFDASGSMKVDAGGQSRIAIAKRAMSQALKDMPAGARLGLLMYGHRRSRDCTDIELVSPIGADGAAKIDSIIQSVQPRGETPIAEALKQAARNFAALKGQTNRIVLITDGIEECGGDPCAAARAIKESGLDLKVHVVGFALNDAKRKAVQCIADATGGKMLDARNSQGLSKALSEVRQEVAQAAPPPPAKPLAEPGNLLLAQNGGHVVWAPDASWTALTTTEEPPKGNRVLVSTHFVPGEVVFGFKDGQAATFDRFTVYVPKTYNRNLKQFELLAGDEPFGEYRSLGRFEAKNLRLMRQPYQAFAVPETTTHYLKLRVLSTYGDTPLYLYGVQVFGKLDGKPVPMPPPGPAAGQIDVLSSANGGTLVAAPFIEWEKVITQPADYTKTDSVAYTHGLPSEAVFAFKEGRRATFDKFAILVPQTYGRNARKVELLAGDDLGSLRSLGSFETHNVRVIASPYQEFVLPETTARYLKVRIVSTHGETPLYLYPMKVFGKLAEGEAQAAAKPGPKPGQTNLLSKANGGTMIAAPFAEWQKVIEQPDDYAKTDSVAYTHNLPSEAIFAFKDQRPATFDKFAVLVPQAYGRNVRQFEILASDDLAGEFRSLGRFETQNLRFKATPYQEFALPETTARYVKLRFINTHGETPLYLYPVKLFGKLSEGGTPAALPHAGPEPGQTNILSAANGGMLIAAPFQEWQKAIAQPDDYTKTDSVAYTHNLPSEAIFAFKDERPATFDKFAILVPQSYGRNARHLEILAGDDPVGEFRSLGRFETQNLRMTATPYQEFRLPKTTAKYVKVRIIDTHGETPLYLYPIKLFGSLGAGDQQASNAPAAPAPAAPAGSDLLHASKGGMLLAAPDASWEKLTTRSPQDTAPDNALSTNNLPVELVYAFKDEKPALVSAVRVLIPSTYGRNLRHFEVLVADDISGEFRSLGKFETKNLRLVQTPFQEFALPPTTARYVKIRLIDTHGDTPLYMYGLQVVGAMTP